MSDIQRSSLTRKALRLNRDFLMDKFIFSVKKRRNIHLHLAMNPIKMNPIVDRNELEGNLEKLLKIKIES